VVFATLVEGVEFPFEELTIAFENLYDLMEEFVIQEISYGEQCVSNISNFISSTHDLY